MIRTSTVPKLRCGRTLHQICVCLDDRVGAEQEVDVGRVRLPAAVVVRDAAAREHAREDLGASGVQPAEACPRPTASSRTRRAAPAAPGAARRRRPPRGPRPRMPTCTWLLKVLLRHATYWSSPSTQPVVRRVDDALVLPGAPRMSAGRAERQALRSGQREQPPAALVLALERVREVRSLAGADLDLRGDQLPGDRVGQDVVALRPRAAAPRTLSTSESVSGSSSANSSSRPTVKSVEVSKISRERSASNAIDRNPSQPRALDRISGKAGASD